MQPIANLGSVQKAATYVLALAIILVRLEIAFGERIPLTFSLILSYGRDGYNSSGTIPAIDLALEHVNSLGVLGEYISAAVFFSEGLKGDIFFCL